MTDEIMYTCGHTQAEFASGQLNRWGLAEVTYCINGYPVGLGLAPTDVDAIVSQAFKSWSDSCGLRFRKVSDPNQANIVMGVARGRRANFDGPMGVLAYCYLPQGSNFQGQVEMYWDLDEAWSKEPRQNGILLLNVTAHELGHGLGLDHTNVPRSLMNPVYSAAISAPQAHDQQEVVQRYGPPSAVPTPIPTPQPIPTPAAGEVPCKCLINGVVYQGVLKPAPQNLEF